MATRDQQQCDQADLARPAGTELGEEPSGHRERAIPQALGAGSSSGEGAGMGPRGERHVSRECFAGRVFRGTLTGTLEVACPEYLRAT